MTTDLNTKLNTPGAFDTPWLKEQLLRWDAKAEQRTADFTERMYRCSGRTDPAHPMHSLYTGLWHDFCIREAGPIMRDRFFETMEAIALYEQGLLTPELAS